MVSQHYRIGVDIGGTFTDLVMLDIVTGRLFNEKVLTTPADPSQGVLDGVRRILATNGVEPSQVRQVIHGTTLVANAIIERDGVEVALITTQGFRDILQIGTEWRYDTYDLFMEVPEPLVPRSRRFEVPERVGPSGEILTPLDEAAVVDVARRIAESGVAAVAISLLHGFRNPVHERRVRDILLREIPELVTCISSEVMPEIGEYERTSTTVCNAYVLPIFKRYLKRLTEGLRSMGIDRDLYLMLSDGGTVHESTAAAYPVRLVQSGPAGGVQATSAIGKSASLSNVLCFDMGGTTAKACLIENGQPLRTTEFEVARVYRFKKGSGLPLRVPVIDMIEIGAGGGSIARVDHLGLIQIGPESSSADPGPACYGRGGLLPTVTDADLVLGYLAPDSFLGGDMHLDKLAAELALQREIAAPLGMSLIDAAWAIHETVNENMAQAANIHALEKAKRITDFAMVPIGGAGPVHACNIALKLGLPQLVCPPGAGVASALGFLVAPAAFTFVQGGVVALDSLQFPLVRAMLDEMQAQGIRLLRAAGGEESCESVSCVAAMRYVGQGYDVDVAVSRDILESSSHALLSAAFEAAYRTQFGRIESAMPVEIVSWRVVVSGPDPKVDLVAGRPQIAAGQAKRGERSVYFGPVLGFVEVPVYDRYRLAPGSRFDGPGVFEERESTTIVPPGAKAHIDRALNLVIDLPTMAAGRAP
jgi:N-methylhydantoinase A